MARTSRYQRRSAAASSSAYQQVGSWWWGLPQAQRRALVATAVALVATLMLIGLFPGAHASWMGVLGRPVTSLLGWGTPLMLIGVVALCVAVIADAVRGHVRLRSSRAWGAVVALAIVLAESRLLFGSPVGGSLGGIGAALMRLLPQPAAHLALLGGLLLDVLIVFRISWHDVRNVAQAVDRSARAQGPIVPVLTTAPADSVAAFAAGTHPASPWSARKSPVTALPSLPSRSPPSMQPPIAAKRAESQATSPIPELPPSEDTLPRDLHIPAYLRRGALASVTTLPSEAFRAASSVPPDRFALPPLPVRRPIPASGNPGRERGTARTPVRVTAHHSRNP